MFGNNSKKTTEVKSPVSQATSSSGINSLVTGTKIKGSFSAQSDIRIDGELEGDLKCDGRVIIGVEGKIVGQIDCQNAVIEGSFEGNLNVKEELDIKDTGKVSGDVNTAKLRIAPGGLFNVTCTMGGQKIKSIKSVGEGEA